MPETDDRSGGGGEGNPKFKPKGPKVAKTKKGKKGKHAKGRKAKHAKGTKAKHSTKGTKAKVKHAPKPGQWHEESGSATAAGHAPSASKETGSVLHPAGKGMAPIELVADAEKGLGTAAGLGGVLLDLVGEGTIKLSGVLAAWARESERITNRTWRRPGGLAKLGGL